MNKIKYNRATGNMSAGYIQQQKDVAQYIASQTQKKGQSKGSVWDSIVNNAGSWLDSIGQTVVGTTAAKNPAVVEDDTPRVLAIAGVGVAAVVLIIALLIIFKK